MNRPLRAIKKVMLRSGYVYNDTYSYVQAPCCLYVLAVSVTAMALLGCKDKDRESPISWSAVEVTYPPVEVQRVRIEKYTGVFTQSEPIQNVDSVLRQMIEDVPLQFVKSYAEARAKESGASERPNVALLLGRITELRSKDHEGASLFVQKAVEARHVDSLCVALFGLRTELSQREAANGLYELKDPKAVRALTIRLANAATSTSGGSESVWFRNELRRALVRALSECTGLAFSDYDPDNESETLTIIKRCQDWLEENEPDKYVLSGPALAQYVARVHGDGK